MEPLPIACSLTPEALGARRAATLDVVLGKARERRDLPSGYAFRFDPDDDVLAELVELIRLERKCCRFLRFDLRVLPAEGPVWLELTGPDGTRTFLAGVLGLST